MAKLFYHGHGSLRLRSDDGFVIYLDPFLGSGYDLPADLILVTHQHNDHKQVDRPAKKPDCRINYNTEMMCDKVGKTVSIGGITVEAVPAYNDHHPVSDNCCGYIIGIDGLKLYFAGDTSTTAEMPALAARKLDYCFLPTDGYYNMGPVEAGECAKLIGARHSVPIHSVPMHGLPEDFMAVAYSVEAFNAFTGPNKLQLSPGTEIEL